MTKSKGRSSTLSRRTTVTVARSGLVGTPSSLLSLRLHTCLLCNLSQHDEIRFQLSGLSLLRTACLPLPEYYEHLSGQHRIPEQIILNVAVFRHTRNKHEPVEHPIQSGPH